MSPFLRVANSAGMISLIVALTGCLSSLAPPMRCAPVAMVNGKHLLLNRTDYLNVETKLSAHLADRGMTLVSDVGSADMLVTIAYEPDPKAPGKVTVLVLDIVPNQMNPNRRRAESKMDRDYSASRPAALSFPRGVGSPYSGP